tara:strand:+ start:275 stop:652 length:378 start_codon:yes stop_codon:yes gene_type:complete
MKLLLCNTCGDIIQLSKSTRTCQCGSCGGHYKEDGVNAIYYGPAIPIGFHNSSFTDAISNQPEYGNGIEFTAFVIPKVCPSMVHVDYLDYFPVDGEDVDLYDDMMEEVELEKKQRKLKNVFKDEE